MDFFTINRKSYFQLILLIAATFLSFSANAQTCINVTSGGSIGSDQTLAAPGTPSALLGLAPAAGGVGAVQYLWMQTNISGASSSSTLWTIIEGANLEDYQPGFLSETTYFIRCARRDGCTEYSKESNIITITIENSLPVELISFGAKAKGNNVDLNWSTASEFNHDYFALEHSANGKDFFEIESFNGDGYDSDTRKDYAYMHCDANNGDNYYRLLQVDVDGKNTYSPVVKANIAFDGDVRLAPNPTFDLMTVKVSELQQSAAVLTLHQANSGQRVRVIDANEGQTEFKVNTEDLAPGMYILQVLSESGVRLATSKFMKANR